MNRFRPKWAVALSASVLLHAGAAALFAAAEEEIQIEGGQRAGVIVLGTAFEDLAAAAEQVETVETVQPETTPVEPVETVQAEAVPIPAEEAPIAPVAPVPSAAVMSESEAAEPLEAEDTVVALAPVPVPTARPTYTPPPPRKTETASAKPATKKPARAGSQGENARDAKRGAAEGGSSDNEGASARSERRTASAAGNAAVSNYPGRIVSKLRRSLRYPAEAKRNRVTGEVHVSFVVSANGATGSIRVIRSSGSPVLDQAALETVRRAAPFPAIPRGAGRDSWPFTVPLAFTR